MTERKGLLSAMLPSPLPGLPGLLHQYAKFGLVGLTATAVHISVFTLLIELLNIRPIIANVAAFSIAVFVSYWGNFYWTFKAPIDMEMGYRRYPSNSLAKFVVVAVTGLLLNSLIVYLTVDLLSLPYGYAIILMVSIVPVIVFALNKLWAFRPV